MASNDNRACLVSTFLSIAVLIGLGVIFAYPITWVVGDVLNKKQNVGIVDFHGLASDHEGNPLSGVIVSGELTTYNFFGEVEISSIRVSSDNFGKFSIGPAPGMSLKINEVSKSGFLVRGRNWPGSGGQYWVFNFSANGLIPAAFDKDTPFSFVLEPSPVVNTAAQKAASQSSGFQR